MSYSAPNRLLMPARHSIDSLADSWMHAYSASGNATAWPSANLAIYVPLRIPMRVIVVKLWCVTGADSTGNVDMALYDATGVAVASATAAAKVNSNEQVFDVTDTAVGPGLYYVGLAHDSTGAFVAWTPAAPVPLAQGVLSEAAAYPLPTTATWAADQSLAMIPFVGVLLESTVA